MPVKSNKWSQYDEPEYRTGGMSRVGYDADTQQYTYKDRDGSLWRSAPGVEYGTLTPVAAHRNPVGRSTQQSNPLPIRSPSEDESDRKESYEFRYDENNALKIVVSDKEFSKEEKPKVSVEPDVEATQDEKSAVSPDEAPSILSQWRARVTSDGGLVHRAMSLSTPLRRKLTGRFARSSSLSAPSPSSSFDSPTKPFSIRRHPTARTKSKASSSFDPSTKPFSIRRRPLAHSAAARAKSKVGTPAGS